MHLGPVARARTGEVNGIPLPEAGPRGDEQHICHLISFDVGLPLSAAHTGGLSSLDSRRVLVQGGGATASASIRRRYCSGTSRTSQERRKATTPTTTAASNTGRIDAATAAM